MIHARSIARLELSAASGLVIDDAGLWVVGDDLPSLHLYDGTGALQERIALVPGLTARAGEPEQHLRKKVKPDFEALVRLPDASLLALGSGSRPQRRTGYRADASRRVTAIDLSPLYGALEPEFPALNIEGALVHGETLLLAHRGTVGNDALIVLDLAQALADLQRARLGAKALRGVRTVALGALDGAQLALTDLANGPDGLVWFSAAAELTDDSYEDGAIRGSVIGRMDADGRVLWRDEVAPVCKIEGLHWQPGAGGGRWLAVADADDPAQRAPLMELQGP